MKQGHGMTFQEIADELGISNARVQQLLNSAINKLRDRQMKTLLVMEEEADGFSERDNELFGEPQ